MTKETTAEQATTAVPRPEYFTAENIKEHLKTVGNSIIADAERLNLDPRLLREIDIKAEIAPAGHATEVEWRFVRYADPRLEVKERTE